MSRPGTARADFRGGTMAKKLKQGDQVRSDKSGGEAVHKVSALT
jgi:hypothetical protein